MSGRLSRRRRRASARLYLLRRLGPRHLAQRRRLRARSDALLALAREANRSLWLAAAASLGATARPLSSSLLEIELDGTVTRIHHDQTTALGDRVSYALARDKPLAYALLTHAGVPVPEHVVADAGDPKAAAALLGGDRPLLVKPATGGGGVGIVGNVRAREQLVRALADAGRYDETLLVERQADGDAYRLLFLDGELLDVLRKRRPAVVGDGVSTVERLLFRECERRLDAGGDAAGYPPLEADLDTLFNLDREGVGLRDVLPAGRGVVVKSAANFGGRELTERVSPADVAGIVEPARVAATALGVRLAGVDVVATDPSAPPASENGLVLEVNPVPGILQHAQASGPEADVFVPVTLLQALLETRTPSSPAARA